MRYLRAFSKYAIGTGLVLVVGLLTTPILTRLISTEDMGKYSMFMTLGNLISTLLCLGLGTVLSSVPIMMKNPGKQKLPIAHLFVAAYGGFSDLRPFSVSVL